LDGVGIFVAENSP